MPCVYRTLHMLNIFFLSNRYFVFLKSSYFFEVTLFYTFKKLFIFINFYSILISERYILDLFFRGFFQNAVASLLVLKYTYMSKPPLCFLTVVNLILLFSIF